MYAIVANGGKQYQVAQGDVVRLEKMTAEVGQKIELSNVLMISDGDQQQIGTPHVAGATVTVEVIAQDRAKKVHIIKFKRRKHHMKQMGHRQDYTAVKVVDIAVSA